MFLSFQHLVQCMCGNNMSVPLLTDAVMVSGKEKETAAVSEHELSAGQLKMAGKGVDADIHLWVSNVAFQRLKAVCGLCLTLSCFLLCCVRY